jgi:C-terminal processing protease CtpA/Prc
VRLASVENRIAIVEITDQELQKNAQVKIGDVVVAVDGEDIAQRISELRKITSGSTEAARLRDVLPNLLAGANGSMAKVQIEDASGTRHEVTLPRSDAFWKFWKARRTGEIFKILPGNIGYADLDRLALKDVDAMFDAFKQTDALILDMRGYPNGTLWRIASRLNVKGAQFGANFSRRIATALPAEQNSLNTFRQPMPKSDKPLYKGKVVMLIDQSTQSQAEHSGLFFEAATAITFIGSASAGADGDLTKLVLPGAISVSFSGQEVRHADGRQLQRVGLQPDIKVAPTLAGVREGRDEVLERAVEFLKAR